jgi:hypothetical protein
MASVVGNCTGLSFTNDFFSPSLMKPQEKSFDPHELQTRVGALAFDRPIDIIWLYKNLAHIYWQSPPTFKQILERTSEIKPLDFGSSTAALEEICTMLARCMDEETFDDEMEFVIKESGLGVELKDERNDWCLDYFYRLSLPFARICTKQVVDIAAFLFTRTSVAEFDELFAMFVNKKDFLVELRLLKVRLMRERARKYRCARCKDSDGGSNIGHLGLEENAAASDVVEDGALEQRKLEESMRALSIKNDGENEAVLGEKVLRPLDNEGVELGSDGVSGMDFYSLDDSHRSRAPRAEGDPLRSDRPFLSPKEEAASSEPMVAPGLLAELGSSIMGTGDVTVVAPSTGGPTVAESAPAAPDLNLSVVLHEVTTISALPALVSPSPAEGRKVPFYTLENASFSSRALVLASTKKAEVVAEPSSQPSMAPATSSKCTCNPQESSTCTCATYDLAEEEKCLAEAKKYLIELEKVAPRFFIENATLYLSLSYDGALFDLFKKYAGNEYRTVCAKNIFRLKKVGRDEIEPLIESMRDSEADILQGEDIEISPMTLGMYIRWSSRTFKSLSISSFDDYAPISRLYIKFLREFRHKGMFRILKGIFECKVERVEGAAKPCLIRDLCEICEIFIGVGKCRESVDVSDGVDPLPQDSPSKEADDLFREIGGPAYDIRRELMDIIREIHAHEHLRKFLLPQLPALMYFSEEFRLSITKGLCTEYGLDWRYRRDLLHAYRRHPHLFSVNVADELINDPVFSVRRMAALVKEQMGG